jgi:hypothetical protein
MNEILKCLSFSLNTKDKFRRFWTYETCPCAARFHNRLICCHNIDHVIKDEHNRITVVVLAKHEIAP